MIIPSDDEVLKWLNNVETSVEALAQRAVIKALITLRTLELCEHLAHNR